MLQGVLVDEAIEVLFQRAGHFGWATGAGAVDKARGAFMRKAIDPLAQSGIGKLERVGDGLQALAFDDFAHRLGPAEDARLFRLLQEDI